MITYEEMLTEEDKATILLEGGKTEAEDEFLLSPPSRHPLPKGELQEKLKPMMTLKDRIIALGFNVDETTIGWSVYKKV